MLARVLVPKRFRVPCVAGFWPLPFGSGAGGARLLSRDLQASSLARKGISDVAGAARMEDEREGGADIPFISAYVMSDPESELRLKSIIAPLVRRYPIPSPTSGRKNSANPELAFI